MEGFFEGPIITSPPPPFQYPRPPVSWLDVVDFAQSKPSEYILIINDKGERTCQFFLDDLSVQILEDDWRLIANGTLNRFFLKKDEPLQEDERVELVTMDIVYKRLEAVIKKADEIARKARQLNYRFIGRTDAINKRLDDMSRSRGIDPTHSTTNYDIRADLLAQFAAASARYGVH
ncbi:hypothetical protein ACHAQA_007632 [Verticillium albo-atrum]